MCTMLALPSYPIPAVLPAPSTNTNPMSFINDNPEHLQENGLLRWGVGSDFLLHNILCGEWATHNPPKFLGVTLNRLLPFTVNPLHSHGRTKEVYTRTFSWPADCQATSMRRDVILVARLRAGQISSSKLMTMTLNAIIADRCRTT